MVFAPCVAILGALLTLSSLTNPALSCIPQLHIHDESPENPVAIGTDGPADPATIGFNLNHLGIQVSDIAASREFYGDVLGLRHIFTFTASEDYIIVYMGYAQGGRNGTGHQTGAEMARDQWNSNGLLELIWAKDNTNIKSRVFGFSHLGFIVPDIQAFQDRLIALNVPVAKKMGELPSAKFAEYFGFHGEEPTLPESLKASTAAFVFVKDPDGYMIEVQQQQ